MAAGGSGCGSLSAEVRLAVQLGIHELYRANEIRKFVPSVIVLRTVLYVTWRNVNNTLYMSHFVFIGICYAKMQKYVTTIFVK